MARLTVGILVATSGPAGLFGPSTQGCALLAVDEINRNQGGLLGFEIQPEFIDTGRPREAYLQELDRLLSGDCKAIIGIHDSAVRSVVSGHIRGRLPYIYTPPYEGDETSQGIFVLGETPYQQLAPVLPWFMQQKQATSWYLIGNAYQWPYTTNWLAKQFIGLLGGEVLGEEYAPFGGENFDHVLRRIEELCPDAVLITLVGSDSIDFNRAFAARGLAHRIIRYGPLIEENTLLGIGADCSRGIFSASGYFTCLDTPENNSFIARYTTKFSANAPMLNAVGQSCYDGLHFLAALTDKAKSPDASKLASFTEGFTFQSPRGTMVMHNRHSAKTIYLAEARGMDFNIIEAFTGVPANAPGRLASLAVI